MLTRAEFVELLQDEMGLEITEQDLPRDFDEVAGWDSVHLLTILLLLEKRSERPLSLPDFLDVGNLESIYRLVTR
ncbi:phosphopantetheine-binding protein [Actinomadura sp. 9N215]|uniref:phosphopantetheine-binding protein n=1 Tax=Actinomadura sp. 9N215 TaxID=3375150 RepID=UPI0037A37538